MTSTPVGMRCPECSRQKTKVRTLRNMHADPVLTYALIAVNVLMYFGSRAGPGGNDFALFGPFVADGEVWRLITAGFMHAGLFHLLMNMYALYWLGQMLEPVLGNARFGALYLTSLLAGSFGALLLSPDAFTVGASGAVFGLMAAAVVLARQRGIDLMQSGLLPVLLLNLAITFFPGFNISIGGHLGGLIGGGLAMLAMEEIARRRLPKALGYVVCGAVAVGAVAGSIAVAAATA
jgi:membrane associated rhomboid family serine protease